MAKVLVTDCWTNKALSVVRSLGRENMEVHAITHKFLGTAVYSKFVKRFSIFPNPKNNPEKFKLKILHKIKNEAFDCVIPLEESSTKIFLENRAEIEKHTKLVLPSIKSFNTANNKWEVLKLAEKLSIPVPKSFLPSSENEIHSCFDQLGFPLIIKPVSSSGSRGIAKIFNPSDFEENYIRIKKIYGLPILQECLDQSGQGVGVGALVSHGNTLVSFSYKRLREFPVSGGPSTLRESTDDKQTKEYAEKLLKELNWDGVAMVEFKMDTKDNLPKLMEVNPRFWGSLELANVSGVNFPHLLYLLSQNKKIVQPEYKTGVRCRWLLPGDVAHFVSNPERFKMKPSFFNFFDATTFYDDFKKDDFPGSVAAVICTLLSIFDYETWKMGVFRR